MKSGPFYREKWTVFCERMDHFCEISTNGETLPAEYCDHPLKGDKKGYRDCHIKGDWVLIYRIDKNVLTLVLSETGTHSDILT